MSVTIGFFCNTLRSKRELKTLIYASKTKISTELTVENLTTLLRSIRLFTADLLPFGKMLKMAFYNCLKTNGDKITIHKRNRKKFIQLTGVVRKLDDRFFVIKCIYVNADLDSKKWLKRFITDINWDDKNKKKVSNLVGEKYYEQFKRENKILDDKEELEKVRIEIDKSTKKLSKEFTKNRHELVSKNQELLKKVEELEKKNKEAEKRVEQFSRAAMLTREASSRMLSFVPGIPVSASDAIPSREIFASEASSSESRPLVYNPDRGLSLSDRKRQLMMEMELLVKQEKEAEIKKMEAAIKEKIEVEIKEKVKEEEEEKEKCIICFDNRKAILFRPCNHYIACGECAKRINKCPVCRHNIRRKVKVYSS